jgi:hypothetical protein
MPCASTSSPIGRAIGRESEAHPADPGWRDSPALRGLPQQCARRRKPDSQRPSRLLGSRPLGSSDRLPTRHFSRPTWTKTRSRKCANLYRPGSRSETTASAFKSSKRWAVRSASPSGDGRRSLWRRTARRPGAPRNNYRSKALRGMILRNGLLSVNGSDPNGAKIKPNRLKVHEKAGLDGTVKFPKLIDHPRSQP